VLHRADCDLHCEGVSACTAMTLKDFGRVLHDGRDFREHIAHHAHANQRQYREPHLSRADLGVVAQDNAGVFELAYAFDDGWSRQTDAARQFGKAEAAMLLQMMEEFAVDAVEREFSL